METNTTDSPTEIVIGTPIWGDLSDTDHELVARKFRDMLFEKPISDKEWETCKANWLKDYHKLTASLDSAGFRVIKKT